MDCTGYGECLDPNEETQKVNKECKFKCFAKKCKNYEFCKTIAPEIYLLLSKITLGLCISCDFNSYNLKNWNGIFETKKYKKMKECPICMEKHRVMVIFPSCKTHLICKECIKTMFYKDSSKYSLNPVEYGCSECPNGCENPKIGYQCNCEEYEEIIDEWKKNFPLQYERWNEEEIESENNGGYTGTLGQCPICRKEC